MLHAWPVGWKGSVDHARLHNLAGGHAACHHRRESHALAFSECRAASVRSDLRHLDGGESGDILLKGKYAAQKYQPDDQIDLRLQQTGYQKVDGISQTIFNTIKDCGGMVAVTDKSQPEDIYALFGVSKKVFKKAIGALYKKKLIIIDTDSIKLTGKNSTD